jgi:hypothetical protein
MLVYYVRWEVDKTLAKGEGRVKLDESYFDFTVLCRGIHDATNCLYWFFDHEYKGKFSFEDGVVSYHRVKIDSRNFNPKYLHMDSIKSPIYLGNLQDSLTKYCMKHFRF